MNIIIPTRFQSEHLVELVEAGRTVATVVIVHTEPGHPPVDGCVNVHDYRRNIHRWWLTGLEVCTTAEALICNDDIEATPEALAMMLDALADADLVVLPKPFGTTPLSGWCYGINADGPLLPDPAYTWWYGEDDMWRRATRDGLRITTIDAPIVHHNSNTSHVPEEFKAAVRADRRLYRSRWS